MHGTNTHQMCSRNRLVAQFCPNIVAFSCHRYSEFFWEALPNMLKLGDNQQVVEGVCGLLYAELLIKFLNVPIKKLQRQKCYICPFSEEINSKIMNTFTLQSQNGRYVLFVLQVAGNWDVVEIIWSRRNINLKRVKPTRCYTMVCWTL